MASQDFVLYDTCIFAAAVPTEFNLFQTLPTDKKLSNTRGPGAMQASESFALQRIIAYVDIAPLEANVGTWFLNSLLEIIESNFTWLQIPLQAVLSLSGWQGADASTAAANQAHIAVNNPPYVLDTPIILGPGKPFTVRVTQGTAAAAATNVKILLDGILTIQ